MAKLTTRPKVSLSFAISLDGKMATRTGNSRGLSSPESLLLLHHLRSGHDAILVGRGTVEKDNPRLTSRISGGRDPIRLILDSKLSLSPKAKVFSRKRGRAFIVTVSPINKKAASAFEKIGVEVIACGISRISLPIMLSALSKMGIKSVLVEGGPTVHTSFIEARLFDRIFAFVSPKLIGGKDSPTPFGGIGYPTVRGSLNLKITRIEKLGTDVLLEAVPVWQE